MEVITAQFEVLYQHLSWYSKEITLKFVTIVAVVSDNGAEYYRQNSRY